MKNIQDCIRTGDTAGLKQIIQAQPEAINQADQRGFTPLTLATYVEAKEMVELLLENGANVNAQDAAGNTALMGVCFKGHLDIAKILIDKGADVNISNHNQATALSFAVNFGKTEMAHLLLEKGANPNTGGISLLQQAKHQGDKAMEELLMSYQ